MDEELGNVLNNEELDTNGRLEAIKKLIGDNYVPTKKYSDDVATVKNENKQLKNSIKEKDTEIEGYKNSQLTDDQKKQKELDDIAQTKRDLAIERSQIQAEKILSKVVPVLEQDFERNVVDKEATDVAGWLNYSVKVKFRYVKKCPNTLRSGLIYENL